MLGGSLPEYVLQPAWNETFDITLDEASNERDLIKFQVYARNREQYGNMVLLGESTEKLSNFSFRHGIKQWVSLKRGPLKQQLKIGQVLVTTKVIESATSGRDSGSPEEGRVQSVDSGGAAPNTPKVTGIQPGLGRIGTIKAFHIQKTQVPRRDKNQSLEEEPQHQGSQVGDSKEINAYLNGPIIKDELEQVAQDSEEHRVEDSSPLVAVKEESSDGRVQADESKPVPEDEGRLMQLFKKKKPFLLKHQKTITPLTFTSHYQYFVSQNSPTGGHHLQQKYQLPDYFKKQHAENFKKRQRALNRIYSNTTLND
ncbi:hypothetical protein FGO68_gene481 [Halteria grandinella]|uniref:C2 domain-containing protein n=1 Tax=Halteria grandinella TaxID=5974 RepID=A0A8J8P175_HALGN|nr:hypothetical protein FGO68_gene481 [Halteria grandinella]